MPLSIPKVDDPVLGRVVPSDTLESAAAAGTFLVPLVFHVFAETLFRLVVAQSLLVVPPAQLNIAAVIRVMLQR